jgi:hypothetical protein
MALLAGCYERFLFGYNLQSEVGALVVHPTLSCPFSFPAAWDTGSRCLV